MLFTFAYGAVAFLGSGASSPGDGRDPFAAALLQLRDARDPWLRRLQPAGDLGHTLAIVEALFGQLYLVTVVAVIVGRLHSGRPERV